MDPDRLRLKHISRWSRRLRLALVLPLGCACAAAAQSVVPAPSRDANEVAAETLPDAPTPSASLLVQEREEESASQQQSPTAQSTTPGFPPVSPQPRKQPPGSGLQHPSIPSTPAECLPDASLAHTAFITCAPGSDPYQRFLNAADLHPLTARQKGRLAWRNATDPFNFLTIGFLSGFSVAADPHSPYGPGLAGFGRNVGVAYTETLVGEFFGTFLIPAVANQDPHYHREPNATIAHRTFHAIAGVVWAQSDTGQGMPNYANLGTGAVGIALGDMYVPGAQQGFGTGVKRYVTAIATGPISNIISEFLPDVARHINVRIVLIQRVVDEVERQNGAG